MPIKKNNKGGNKNSINEQVRKEFLGNGHSLSI